MARLKLSFVRKLENKLWHVKLDDGRHPMRSLNEVKCKHFTTHGREDSWFINLSNYVNSTGLPSLCLFRIVPVSQVSQNAKVRAELS